MKDKCIDLFNDYYNNLMTLEELSKKYNYAVKSLPGIIGNFKKQTRNWFNLVTNPLYKRVFDKWFYKHIPAVEILKPRYGDQWLRVWKLIFLVETNKRKIPQKKIKAVKKIMASNYYKEYAKKHDKHDKRIDSIEELRQNNREIFLKVMTTIKHKTFDDIYNIIKNLEDKYGVDYEDIETTG